MNTTARCKHGVCLNSPDHCPSCESLWNADQQELEDFFRKGIETIAGQREAIKKLEQALEQSPVVWCASCETKMQTFRQREHTSIATFEKGSHREVAYVCPTRGCHSAVWVRKLRHPLQKLRDSA